MTGGGDRLDLLFTHPYFWPHVRRGAERTIAEVGGRLAARGQRVRLLTGTPERWTQRRSVGGIDVRYVHVPIPGAASRAGATDLNAFAAAALPWLAAQRGDLVHAWHYPDAWAAVRARRVRRVRRARRRPIVLFLTGTVRPERMAGVRFDRRMVREAIEGADRVWCYSEFAREQMSGFGVPMEVVPGGVDLARFHPAARSSRPTVFCGASPDEPRKRIVDLVDAWPLVLEAVPDARLVLAGHASETTRHALLDRLPAAAAGSVEFPGVLGEDDLVKANATAWACVSPGVKEAFGLVTLEALACGTPVVGIRSGATPELLTAETGTLYEPADPASCATAVLAALHLAQQPGAAERCRAAAEPFSWDEVTAGYMARYRRLLSA